MTISPEKAMILAAGLGVRMRPITERTPKPLVRVAGKAMLDWALEKLDQAGVEKTVINIHHHAAVMRLWIQDHEHVSRIIISDESACLLDSGGGVRYALPALGWDPFFLLNADAVWMNGSERALSRLAQRWNFGNMDGLMLLVPTSLAMGYCGDGDFFMEDSGQLRRAANGEKAPYVYAGVMILNPSIFVDVPSEPFSLNVIFDRMLEQGRLFGLVHDGAWFHIGTPEALEQAETYFGAMTETGSGTEAGEPAVVR